MDMLWTPWRYAYVTDDKPVRAGVPPELAAWPGDLQCVFCNLLASTAFAVEHGTNSIVADRAARIVLRMDTCFLVLNAFPYASGHVMIVPYAHQGSLAALPAVAAQEMMLVAQRVDRVLQQIYSPDGINLGMNLGKAAGAGVADHLHMHMLPRWVGDTNFITVIGETRILPEQMDITWDRLRNALDL